MTPTRRNRKSASNTNKKPKTNKTSNESSEEESSDTGSITRCVCGQAHNVGLMVQCDKCEVWQHCECIGLNQDRLPDHYYCDQCQPENHQVKTSTGRAKRLYNAGLVNNNTTNNTTTVSPASSNSDKEEGNSKRLPKRRKKNEKSGLGSPKTPLIEAKTEMASPVITGEDPVMGPLAEERSTRSRRTKIPADAEDGLSSSSVSLIPEIKKKASSSPTPNDKKSSKPKSQSSSRSSATPQQQLMDDFGSSTHTPHANTSSPYWNFASGRPTRESSPPAKIKYPDSKMSFSDMNKRAKQIMECITKMQSEELKRSPPTCFKKDAFAESLFEQDSFVRPRSLSTSSSSSSISSASTVPLLDDYGTTTSASSPSTPIPYIQKPHEETSIEILERVSRELSKFQRKFGIVYQQHPSSNKGNHYHSCPQQHQNSSGKNSLAKSTVSK